MSLCALNKKPTQQTLLPDMINNKGVWSNTTYYYENDLVLSPSTSQWAIAIQPNINQNPDSSVGYWLKSVPTPSLPQSPLTILPTNTTTWGINPIASGGILFTYQQTISPSWSATPISGQIFMNINFLAQNNGNANPDNLTYSFTYSLNGGSPVPFTNVIYWSVPNNQNPYGFNLVITSPIGSIKANDVLVITCRFVSSGTHPYTISQQVPITGYILPIVS